MKKLTYLLMLSVFTSFAQTEQKNTVKFSAKIENRNSDTLTIYGSKRYQKIIPINEKGLFEATLEISDGIHQFSDGVESSLMYLKKRDDLSMTMNAKEFDESIKYKGKGANENNFMVQKALKDEQFELTALDKDSVEFNTLFEAKKKLDFESLESKDLDETFKSTIKMMMTQQFKGLLDYYNENSQMKALNGKPSPTFAYENHKGGITKLEDFKGKLVYIDVWATWCGPCIGEIPSLKALEEKFHDTDIVFVSISIDKEKDKEKWKTMVDAKELGGVQLFSDKDWSSQFVKEYNIQGIPRFIIVGRNGEIINANADRPSSKTIENVLKNLLEKK